jgi:hypothetical protein
MSISLSDRIAIRTLFLERQTEQSKNYPRGALRSVRRWPRAIISVTKCVMLTVLIEAGTDEAALARTLNSLIAAAVEGLVREVIVLSDPGDKAARAMAEQSGGDWRAADDLLAAVAAARGTWLLLLEAGTVPEAGWMEPVSLHMEHGAGPARFARSPLTPRPLLQRLFRAERLLALGLLLPKSEAGARARQGRAFADFAAGLKPRVLAAQARPAR